MKKLYKKICGFFKKGDVEVVEEVRKVEQNCCESPDLVTAKRIDAKDIIINYLEANNIKYSFINDKRDYGCIYLCVNIEGNNFYYTLYNERYHKIACLNCRICIGWRWDGESMELSPTTYLEREISTFIERCKLAKQICEVD